MNINDAQGFTQRLSDLKPAATEMDPRRVFYEAGFKACSESEARHASPQGRSLVAACLMTCVLVAPASFYVGKSKRSVMTMQNGVAVRDAASPDKQNPAFTSLPEKAAVPPDNVSPATSSDATRIMASQASDNPQPTSHAQLSRWLFPFTRFIEPASEKPQPETMLSVGCGTFLSKTDNTLTGLDAALAVSQQTQHRMRSNSPPNDQRLSPSPRTASELLELMNTQEAFR